MLKDWTQNFFFLYPRWIKTKTNYNWKQGFLLQDQGVELTSKGLYKSNKTSREIFYKKLFGARIEMKIL